MASGAVDVRLLHHACSESIVDVDIHKTSVLGRELERRTVHACLELVCDLAHRLDADGRVEELLVFLHVHSGGAIANDNGNRLFQSIEVIGFRSRCRNSDNGVLVACRKAWTLQSQVRSRFLAVKGEFHRSLSIQGRCWETFINSCSQRNLHVLELARHLVVALLVRDFEGVLHGAETIYCRSRCNNSPCTVALEVQHPYLFVFVSAGASIVLACRFAYSNDGRVKCRKCKFCTFVRLVFHRQDVILVALSVSGFKVNRSSGLRVGFACARIVAGEVFEIGDGLASNRFDRHDGLGAVVACEDCEAIIIDDNVATRSGGHFFVAGRVCAAGLEHA